MSTCLHKPATVHTKMSPQKSTHEYCVLKNSLLLLNSPYALPNIVSVANAENHLLGMKVNEHGFLAVLPMNLSVVTYEQIGVDDLTVGHFGLRALAALCKRFCSTSNFKFTSTERPTRLLDFLRCVLDLLYKGAPGNNEGEPSWRPAKLTNFAFERRATRRLPE